MMTSLKENQVPTSILEHLSPIYQTKTSQGGHILDQPSLGMLEFYPAGYTKPDANGLQRQLAYEKLYTVAKNWDKEDLLYPFGKEDCQILLIKEPTNKFDPNAIRVVMNIRGKLVKKWDPPYTNIDLGYVPMKISQMVTKNMGMIGKSTILRVSKNIHEKYYSAKIVVKYGPGGIATVDKNDTRFYALLDE